MVTFIQPWYHLDGWMAGWLNQSSGCGLASAGLASASAGTRSIVRTWRVPPLDVRTSAEGITPWLSRSITAVSPEYMPDASMRTRSPTAKPARPAPAVRLIRARLGRSGDSSEPAGGARLVAVLGGG